MLSHPNPSERSIRHHRRQQSTPIHFEAIQHLPIEPAQQERQPGLRLRQEPHRRGMSLTEQLPSPHQQEHTNNIMVETNTNTGQQQSQHFQSQEAQTHSQARPGYQELQRQQQREQPPNPQLSLEQQEELERFREFQHQQLDAQINRMMRGQFSQIIEPTNNQHVHKMERAKSGPGTFGGRPLLHAPEPSTIAMPGVLLAPFSPQLSYRPATARSEGSFEGRDPSRSVWSQQTQKLTKQDNKSSNGNFPQGLRTSPHNIAGPFRISCRTRSVTPIFEDEMDTSVTIKARKQPQEPAPISAMQIFSGEVHEEPQTSQQEARRPSLPRSFSSSEAFDWDAHFNIQEQLPTAPSTASSSHPRQFDIGTTPSETQPLQLMTGAQPADSHYPCTPSADGSVVASPHYTSIPATPDSHFSLYGGDVASMSNMGCDYSQPTPAHSARQSVEFCPEDSPGQSSSKTRSAALDDFGLDATIEDTGISIEEVQAYISQPNPVTGKWTCLYPECGKIFGRKENVRAHVQTHLGDRQFKCIHCGKCFVRSHDLKRHSKTHSGVKPYPCRCGNSFARHDALTRHRQRGICSGGIAGVVKKQAKRGRPRKQRPDDDERANKAATTRRRASTKDSYAESVSGPSQSSQATSPRSVIYDAADLPYLQGGSMSNLDGSFDISSFTLRPEMLVRTPPLSPSSTTHSLSPRKANSVQSAQSPRSTLLEFNRQVMDLSSSENEFFHDSPSSHFESAASSPPELSHSSPPASAKQLEFNAQDKLTVGNVHQSPNKEAYGSPELETISYSHSPEHYFNDPDWRADSLFDFNTASTGDFKFSTSFDDELLFSDAIEGRNEFF